MSPTNTEPKRLTDHIKSTQAIEAMREAGKITASVFEMLDPYVTAGVSLNELDQRAHDFMVEKQCHPAPLGYHGYPKSICTSVNHVICHGIPSDKKLKNGDIVGIDISLKTEKGYYGDSCKTYMIGKPSIRAKRLTQVAQECLYLSIKKVKPGVRLKTISAFIEAHAVKNHCSVVREFCGHGIGTELHESGFQVLHYDSKEAEDILLEPGLTFTIEPMINFGKPGCTVLPDGWTAVTKDRSLSAQWEHTLLVTETGCDVLTARKEEAGLF
jgi:methionyl aminopeptidase